MLSQQARFGLAVRLHGNHRLSLGKAAELAGLSIIQFVDLLRTLLIAPVVRLPEMVLLVSVALAASMYYLPLAAPGRQTFYLL